MRIQAGRWPFYTINSALRRLLPPAFMLVASGAAFAVASGAGGGFRGSSDDVGGLIIELIFWILWSLPFPYNIIGLAILGGSIWYFGRQVRAVSGLNRIPSIAKATGQTFTVPPEFLTRNPGFEPASLLAKANKPSWASSRPGCNRIYRPCGAGFPTTSGSASTRSSQ
jgi:hypothetical protein